MAGQKVPNTLAEAMSFCARNADAGRLESLKVPRQVFVKVVL